MTWTGKNEILDETVAFDELVAMLEEAGAAYAVKRVPKDAMVFWHGEADGNRFRCVGDFQSDADFFR